MTKQLASKHGVIMIGTAGIHVPPSYSSALGEVGDLVVVTRDRGRLLISRAEIIAREPVKGPLAKVVPP